MKKYSISALSTPFEVLDKEQLTWLCTPFNFEVVESNNARSIRLSCKSESQIADENGWLSEYHFMELLRGLRPILAYHKVFLLINHAIDGELLRMDAYQITKKSIEHKQISIDMFYGFSDIGYWHEIKERPVSLDDQDTDDLPF